MKKITVNANEAGTSLVKILNKYLKEASNGFLYKMLRKKNITLNGKKASGTEKVLEGDVITFFLSDETYEKFSGGIAARQDGDKEFQYLKSLINHELYPLFQVIDEEKDILVINKPSGMLSQKAKPEDVSANELLLAYLIHQEQLDEETFHTFRPSIANRLDRNTSGLLLCGKTMKGLQELAEALKNRTVEKYYICLVKGVVEKSLSVEGYLVKDEKTNKVTICKEPSSDGKMIKTAYEPISNNGKYTRLRVHLITGRTHQIRAHLAYLGHPILGDYKYGNREVNERLKRQYGVKDQLLHAYEMFFADGKHLFAPIPEIFDTIERER